MFECAILHLPVALEENLEELSVSGSMVEIRTMYLQNTLNIVRFDVFTAVRMVMLFFRVLALCRLVGR
jgi:hypothetical protein